MKPVTIEVLMPLPESYGLCPACEMLVTDALPDQRPLERGLAEYTADWQAEFRQLMGWVAELTGRYRDRVFVQLYDPRSPHGLWKALRHRARRYPTFIVRGPGRPTRIVGWDRVGLETAVATALA